MRGLLQVPGAGPTLVVTFKDQHSIDAETREFLDLLVDSVASGVPSRGS